MRKLTKMFASALLTITLFVGGTMLPSGDASAATVIAGVPEPDQFNPGLLLVEDELMVKAGQTPTFTSEPFLVFSELIIRTRIVGEAGAGSRAFDALLEPGETTSFSPGSSSTDQVFGFAARFFESQVDVLAADEKAPFFSDQPLQIWSVSGLTSGTTSGGGGDGTTTTAPIPLPAALWLLLGGLGTLGLGVLRRRQARAA